MRRLKLGLLASAALLAAACATATNTSTPTNTASTGNADRAAATPAVSADELASARSSYNAACVKCHKENGEGGVAKLDEGSEIKVPSFKTEHSIKHTDEQFARKIANGDSDEGMPPFKDRLTPEQISGLVRFIRAEFQSGGPKPGAGH